MRINVMYGMDTRSDSREIERPVLTAFEGIEKRLEEKSC